MSEETEIAYYWEGNRKGKKKELKRIVQIISKKRKICDDCKQEILKSIQNG